MAKMSGTSEASTPIEQLIVEMRDGAGSDPLLKYKARLASVVRLQKQGVEDAHIEEAFGIRLKDPHRVSMSFGAAAFKIAIDWYEPPVDATSTKSLDGRLTIRLKDRSLYAPGWQVSALKLLKELSVVVRRLRYEREQYDPIRLDAGFDDHAPQRLLLSSVGNAVLLRFGAYQTLLEGQQVDDVLCDLGAALSDRIRWVRDRGYSSPEQELTLEAWRNKFRQSNDERIAAFTRIAPESDIFPELRTEAAKLSADERDWRRRPSLILETARLSSRFGDPQIRALMREVRARAVARTRPRPELKKDSDAAKAILAASAELPPFETGYLLARWFRARLSRAGLVGDDMSPLDPNVILRRWGVELVMEAIPEVPEIDAFAIWEEGRKPLIVLNEAGTHIEKSEGGRRATVAHEICHLLVDRGNTLPIMEIKEPGLFPPVEKRAGAFAAELLLPLAAVTELAKRIRSEKELLATLTKRFNVSQALARNQITNAPKN